MGVKLRMWVAWVLFIAWVCWLGWQSYFFGRFPVVSHAQFMTADVAVLAKVAAAEEGRPSPKVIVQSVIWPADANKDLEGKELLVGNWTGCDGFNAAGEYVVPLTRNATGEYSLAGIPRSPLLEPSRYRRQIYPAIPVVLKQVNKIPVAIK